MKIKFLLFIITLIISLQATTVYGMGVGVSPEKMSFKLAPGKSAEQPMYVINTGNETAKYDVFVNESAYQNWFTFSPSSFDLKAGEIKEVKVTLNVPASTETDFKCKINIPCTVPGRTVGAGVKIPVHVEFSTLEESSSEGVASSGSSSSDSSSSGSSSKGASSKGASSDSNSSKEVASNGSSSKGASSDSSYYAGTENSSNSLTEIEIKETLKQSLEKTIDGMFNFTQSITYVDEKLKNCVEHLQTLVTRITGNAIRSFDVTTKSLVM